MNQMLERIFANGFRDLAGLTVSGSVPVREELINEMLGELLTKASVAGEPARSVTDSASGIDVKALLGLVKKLSVEATPGVVTVHFDIRA